MLGYLFDGLLNISKARMRFKEHCISFNLQSKRWSPKNIFQGSIGKFEVSRIMSSLGHLFGGLPSIFKNKNEVRRKSRKVYIPRQKKKSQECISTFNWQKIEVSIKMSSLGLMNSQYNITKVQLENLMSQERKVHEIFNGLPNNSKARMKSHKGLQKFN